MADINGIPIYVSYYEPSVEILVWGKKRNWLCNWDYYETRLQLNKTSFTIDAWENYAIDKFRTYSSRKTYSLTVPFIDTYGDYELLKSTTRIGHRLFNEPVNAFPFTKAHAEGTSRGVGYRWANINCQ